MSTGTARSRGENTADGAPPRITHVTLLPGTVYTSVYRDRMSGPERLEAAVMVEVRMLALEPGEVGMYALGDMLFLVAYEDEVRHGDAEAG